MESDLAPIDAPTRRTRPAGALTGLIGFSSLLLGYATSPLATVDDTFLILAALFLLVGLVTAGLAWIQSRADYGLLAFGTGLALLSVVMTTVIGSTLILGSAGHFAGLAVVVHVALVLGLGLSVASLLGALACLRFVQRPPAQLSSGSRIAHGAAIAIQSVAAVAGLVAFVPLLISPELDRIATTIALTAQVLATLSLLVAFALRR